MSVSVNKPSGAEFVRWMAPVLDCLRAVGGSAKPKEVSAWIRRELDLPLEIAERTNKSGSNRFHNQVMWARQYLVWQGYIDDSKWGVWTLTPLGWSTHLDNDSARDLFLNRVRINQATRQADMGPTEIKVEEADETPIDLKQEETLLELLRILPSYGFELICERLLREHGFEDVSVTQKSRDGGIDGYGVLRLSPFVSVKVAFQAKRYKDVVGRAAVGEFRNALLGRAEKGVFITTGRFTTDAEMEASREGVIPIELVDGERLVDLFEKAGLGVKPKQIYEIDHSFFDHFRRES
ncbi:MAG: restriction endonuclease [Proteobacteria bacterium]|nr:restriction endonuclease [Pseudomonadota bacterium]